MPRESSVLRALVMLLAFALVACDIANDTRRPAPVALNTDGALVADESTAQQGDTTFTLFVHADGAFERAPQLMLTDTLMLTRGADDDPQYDLTDADDVTALPDGRLAVSVDGALLIFDSRGRGQHRWGRRGQGPGEFGMVTGVIRGLGDTLMLPDVANARINLILPDAGVVATRSAPALLARMATGTPGAFRDGRFLVTARSMITENLPDTATRSMANVFLFGLDSTLPQVLRLADLDVRMIETRFRGRVQRQAEMPRVTRRAMLAVLDTVFVSSTDGTYTIDVRRPEGRLVSRIHVERSRRPVPEDFVRTMLAQELERLSASNRERMVDPVEIERLVRARPTADSLPHFMNWFTTPDNLLWAVDYRLPSDSAWTAMAFRIDGSIVGRLVVPGGGHPVAFGIGTVVERVTDEDDVVSLVTRRIVPVPSQ